MANLDHFNSAFTANGQTFAFDTPSCTGAYIQFQGTHAGFTVAVEGTVDGGATWHALGAYQVNSSGTPTAGTSITPGTNGDPQYYVMVGACQQARLRATAFTSGTLVFGILTVLDADPILAQTSSGSTTVSNFSTAAGTGDGSGGPTTTSVYADQMLYNGTTWDRFRGNSQGALDGSSARTASGNSAAFTNYNWAGAVFFLNVTAVSGTTPTMLWKIQWSYDGGTTYVDLDATNATTASITGTGTFKIVVYPGVITAANAALNHPLPRNFRTAWVIGGTTPSFTFASYAQYIL
jgi:hypothetical protein